MKVSWRSCAVTCSAAEDVKRRSYPNSCKNTIKIKRSSVFFSSFVCVFGLLSSLLFERLSGLDCRLAIGDAVLIVGKVVVDLSGWSL